jgi:hypothetical protein
MPTYHYKVDPRTGKRIPIHRYIMQQRLGRVLGPNQVVHHINNNPQDNRIRNLRVETTHNHTAMRHRNEDWRGNKNPSCHMSKAHREGLRRAWKQRKQKYGSTGAKDPAQLRRRGYVAGIKKKKR